MTVMIALISSLLLSLNVLPTLFFWVLRQPRPKSDFWNSPKLIALYRWLFGHPFTSLALALVLPIMGFLSMSTLREQFFPPTDRSQIRMAVELPNSRTLAVTEEVTQAIRQRCLEYDQIQDVHWFLGRSVPKFYYNLLQNRDREPFYGEALIESQNVSQHESPDSNIAKRSRGALPRGAPQGHPTRTRSPF